MNKKIGLLILVHTNNHSFNNSLTYEIESTDLYNNFTNMTTNTDTNTNINNMNFIGSFILFIIIFVSIIRTY